MWPPSPQLTDFIHVVAYVMKTYSREVMWDKVIQVDLVTENVQVPIMFENISSQSVFVNISHNFFVKQETSVKFFWTLTRN